MMKLLFFTLILCVSYVIGTRRFVFDNDNDFGTSVGHSALAINTCFAPKGGETGTYYKYTCSPDGTSVTKTEYSDDACTTGANVLATWSDTETSPCGTPKFECDSNGVDDFVMIKIYVEMPSGTCAASLSTTNLPVVPGCFCNTASASYQASCTSLSDGSFVQYSALDCGGTPSSTDLASCTFVTQVTSPATLDVSYKMEQCAKTPTEAPTQSPIPGVSINPTESPSSSNPTLSPVTNAPTASPVTSSPSAATDPPTKTPSVAPVPAPAEPTRFVLDNDWALGDTYSFPFDMCLQVQPAISLGTMISMKPEFVYYECNDATGNVDKYKWTETEVPTIDAAFDCADKSSSVQTEFVFDSGKTNCDVGYFECDGVDNYATLSLSTQLSFVPLDLANWDCNSATLSLLTTSVATNVCFCDSSGAEVVSGKLICDSSIASALNYTGSDCSGQATETEVGAADECSHFVTIPQTTEIPMDLPVASLLNQCVEEGALSITDPPTAAPVTAAPTTVPTTAPTTAPTDDEVEDAALFFTAQMNTLCTSVVILMLYTL